MKYLVSYGATALVFFALDFIWLSTATPFYRERLGELLLEKPNLQVAGLFYLVYVGGVVVLAVLPALNTGTWINALIAGAVLGLVAYGTYDLTNQSTLRGWSSAVTFVDLAWGTALTATAATAGYLATKASGLG